MIINLLKKIFGTKNDRIIKNYKKEIQKINELEFDLELLTDQKLQEKSLTLKKQINNNQKTLDDVAYEAFAYVREAAKRVNKTRHFDVQLMAGLGLHRGNIIEMKTGEGKTLSSTLAIYLNALKSPVHVITVNEYLAKRDSENMGLIYNFLGLTVGYIYNNMPDAEKELAYKKDIIYGTSSEFGFDFLRDNMRYKKTPIQTKLAFAMIDEADSVLIDEARTPLIISGSIKHDQTLYKTINDLILNFSPDCFELDEKTKNIFLTEIGAHKAEEYLYSNNIIKHDEENKPNENSLLSSNDASYLTTNKINIYESKNIQILHLINQALKAHFIFKRDVDYMVQNGAILIVDQLTGRTMQGRRYSDGIHQAIEQKENVEVKEESRTLASITIQNYFKMYKKLAGMTGTAITEAAELKDIYNLDVIAIPTNNAVKRIDHDDEIYGTKEEKYNAILSLILERHAKGQPILIGTTSIEKSEELSHLLNKNNIKHNVLNAKNHEQEANIIAKAGAYKEVTIATNMAGRGTDIILGGSYKNEYNLNNATFSSDINNQDINLNEHSQNKTQKQLVEEAGGLFVIGTERHESRRIDNQLRGRSGRQGDSGESKFFLSLEDDLMKMFTTTGTADLLKRLGLKNGEMIKHSIITKSISKTQSKIEAQNYEFRKNLIKFDDIVNQQRKIIYEYRNKILFQNELIIDDILYILRVWVKDQVLNCIPLDSFKEEWNLTKLNTILKNTLTFNLDTEEIIKQDITIEDLIEILNVKIVQYLFDRIFNYAQLLNENIMINLNALIDSKLSNHQVNNQTQGSDSQNVNDHKQNINDRENILNKDLIIIRDFIVKILHITPDAQNTVKYIFLQVIDNAWQDHLNTLDILRQNTNLRSYGQKDPFLEYKNESFHLFEDMLNKIDQEVLSNFVKLNFNNIPVQLLYNFQDELALDDILNKDIDKTRLNNILNITPSGIASQNKANNNLNKLNDINNIINLDNNITLDSSANLTSESSIVLNDNFSNQDTSNKTSAQYIKLETQDALKINRNSSCFCGSNLKYKHCHGNKFNDTSNQVSLDNISDQTSNDTLNQISLNNISSISNANSDNDDSKLVINSQDKNQANVKIEYIKTVDKISRNSPCFCGSNLKYKNCHGDIGINKYTNKDNNIEKDKQLANIEQLNNQPISNKAIIEHNNVKQDFTQFNNHNIINSLEQNNKMINYLIGHIEQLNKTQKELIENFNKLKDENTNARNIDAIKDVIKDIFMEHDVKTQNSVNIQSDFNLINKKNNHNIEQDTNHKQDINHKQDEHCDTIKKHHKLDNKKEIKQTQDNEANKALLDQASQTQDNEANKASLGQASQTQDNEANKALLGQASQTQDNEANKILANNHVNKASKTKSKQAIEKIADAVIEVAKDTILKQKKHIIKSKQNDISQTQSDAKGNEKQNDINQTQSDAKGNEKQNDISQTQSDAKSDIKPKRTNKYALKNESDKAFNKNK